MTLVGVNFLIQGEKLHIFPIQKGYFLYAASLLVSVSFFFSIKYEIFKKKKTTPQSHHSSILFLLFEFIFILLSILSMFVHI